MVRFVTTSVYLLIGCFMLVAPVTTYSQNRPTSEVVDIEKKLIEGKKYTLLGDWAKAEAIFRAILKDDVQNSAACYELSRTLNASGNVSEALTFIQKAIRIEPDNEWYQLMEADIHEKAGDIYAAMDNYDHLIKIRPDKAQYYEMQINFCKKTGELVRLLSVLDQYEQLRGVNEAITKTRFETLDSLGRKEEALMAIDRLAKVFSSNTDYKFLAASYAKKTGQDEKAQQYYRDILVLEPENTRAKLALASAEKQAGDDAGYIQSIMPVINNPTVDIDLKIHELIPYVVSFSKSMNEATGQALLDATRQLIKTHPKEAKSYAINGDVFSILHRDQEAIAAYTQATVLNGSVYTVWQQLIGMLMSNRMYDELIRQAQFAIDNFPNQAYLYYASGYGSYKKKQYDAALEMLNEALIMTGRNMGQKIGVYNILGLVYDELGDLEKSYLAFETALGLDPKHVETMANYSLVLSRRITQSEKATAMTDKILAMGPQPPKIHEILAQVLYNQKKYNLAYESIQQVLAAEPNGDAYNLAGDIALKMGNAEEAVSMWQHALDSGLIDSDLKRKIAEHKGQ